VADKGKISDSTAIPTASIQKIHKLKRARKGTNEST
jgi:hypothetical protein